ncbi:triose-phosphate isomerase [Candidatus Pelagibacter sp.]|uniref:triose-phosphate isomerase n=1 Tax=Candidatus Pelagibacter sp. TaxID=2024849 RepID=UPI003F835ABD
MTNKYTYFIANWKMFGNQRSISLLDKVISFVKKHKKNNIKVIYFPPATLINLFDKKLKTSPIEVGAQNCHTDEKYGAYTGQINSYMLKDAGAKYIILGHSENRQFGDSDNIINLKIRSSINSGLKVIFCIGETLNQKRKKNTKKVLLKQITQGLKNIKNKKNIIIAYEPVWSIGSGLIPKETEIFEIVKFIKNKLNGSKVLYGGSVNFRNIELLKKIHNLDGYLIGGASQNPNNFIDIIKKSFN